MDAKDLHYIAGLSYIPDAADVQRIVDDTGFPDRVIRSVIDFTGTHICAQYLHLYPYTGGLEDTDFNDYIAWAKVLTDMVQVDFASTWRIMLDAELSGLTPRRLEYIESTL